MSTYSEQGYAEIVLIDSSGAYRFHRADYEALCAQWHSGQAFIEATTFSGARISIKASRIESLNDYSPECLALSAKRLREEKADALVEDL